MNVNHRTVEKIQFYAQLLQKLHIINEQEKRDIVTTTRKQTQIQKRG